MKKTLPERFMEKIHVTETCWVWIGGKTGSGYGVISGAYNKENGKCISVSAHRYSFFLHKGYLPDEIDHTCFNPGCVNPKHLEEVTHSENMKRSDVFRGIRSAKTHCPHGHEYAGENLFYRRKRNRRECRTCNNIRSKERKMK